MERSMSVAEQAARWAVRLEAANKDTQAQFARWLRQSPLHIQEYLLLTAVDRELAAVDLSDIDTAALSASLRSSAAPTVEMSRSPKYSVRLALAASVIAAVMAGWWFLFGPGTLSVYKTGVGEQRKLALADGTIVQLEPLSRLHAKLSDRARDIELIAGEASFDVRHDAQRPFRVRAREILIEDIGTLFRVHRRSSGMVISVMEGAVDISAHAHRTYPKTRISAGEQARIGEGGQALRRQRLQPEPASSLHRRRLLFN
jgi:transmembrane sensor